MLVDDLIEWRNVVIASSGSSVRLGVFTALGYIDRNVWGVSCTYGIYKDDQFIKYI